MKAVLVRTAAVLAVVIGVGVFLLAVTVGDCSAFGGSCPATGVNDDVLGTAGIAGVLMGAGVMLAVRPAMRTLPRAAMAALIAGVVFAGLGYAMTST